MAAADAVPAAPAAHPRQRRQPLNDPHINRNLSGPDPPKIAPQKIEIVLLKARVHPCRKSRSRITASAAEVRFKISTPRQYLRAEGPRYPSLGRSPR